MSRVDPFLIGEDRQAQRLTRLQRTHGSFSEEFLQDLLEKNPQLLPVAALRPDVGELVCLGREVPTDSGTIDNLYLSTGGYVVVVETKLWRNPQSRREVFAQVMDYVKFVVTTDFEWLSSVWRGPEALLERMDAAAGEAFDEADYIDRVERALERGQVIALIVGDGIEGRLQQLVEKVGRGSVHLDYSLGLVALRCYTIEETKQLLVLPELVQKVESVLHGYIRIELSDALAGQVRVVSEVAEKPHVKRASGKRSTLTEEDLFDGLMHSVGREETEKVRRFIENLGEMGIEPEFKSASMMLKVPHPKGELPGASLLGIEKSGRIYNPDHGRGQTRRWGWDEEAIDRTIGAYWRSLARLDPRFSADGMSHMKSADFVPLHDVIKNLDAIREAVRQAVIDIEREVRETPQD